MSTDLATLWTSAQRIRDRVGYVERATNESIRREWEALDAELTTLGVPTYDRHGPSTPGHAWWTAQTTSGRIIGRWAESFEEAALELSLAWDEQLAWCVPDTALDIDHRYPGRRHEPRIFPVTTEPIPGPDYAPLAPLF